MSVKLPATLSNRTAVSPPKGESQSIAAMKMAPLSLTPLPPPDADPSSFRSLNLSEDKAGREHRQTRFADKQSQLLGTLAAARTQAGPGEALLPAQRVACEELLKTLVVVHSAGSVTA